MVTWSEQLNAYCQDEALANVLCPQGRGGDSWQPTAADSRLAWFIYTELRTRIVTQPLPLRDGVERTALKSLVDLFPLTRREVAGRPEAQHVASLLVHSLNEHVRPLTARWHPKAESGALMSLDGRFDFRSDLSRLQRIMRALAAVLGQICGDGDAAQMLLPLAPERSHPATTREQLPFGIPLTADAVPQIAAMNAAERRILNLRRGRSKAESDAPVANAVGLAMSGGGIRSATFCLGIVQVLTRRGVLSNVDVMSTVSGGGYLGSFITSAMSSANDSIGLGARQTPFDEPGNIESKTVRHLRNHSKYLSEGGVGTLALMIFSAVYGVAMSIVLVAPMLLVLATVAVYGFGLGSPVAPLSASTLLQALLIVLAVVVILLSVMARPSGLARMWIERMAIALLFSVLAVWCWQRLGLLHEVAQGRTAEIVLASVLLPALLGAAGLWWGTTALRGRVAWASLVITGPVFFLSLWLLAVQAVQRTVAWEWTSTVSLLIALLIYTFFFVNINFASLHLYYRTRLVRTYLRQVDVPEAVDPLPLSDVNQSHKAPLHLINAAANLPASKNPELRGRNTDFFVFAQHYCGGPSVGWWPTPDWEAQDRHLDLGTAMAISGAAAAPRMGMLTSARYTTLLAMLNVRLGYWLRKPVPAGGLSRVPGTCYFLRELTGLMHERLPFVNLSDGGHIENLGIYELLRRRCRYIVAIDGEADPEHTFGGLLNAIQMAEIDLGVRMEPDLSDLRDGVEHFKRAHFVMTRIDYGVVENGEPVLGLLLVIKLALTGNESETLMRYRRENPTFPHQSTAQQLFSESQFEAYRALGEHAANAAFDELLVGNLTPGDVATWLSELERRLLPAPSRLN
jgi:hypothetical protein